MSKAKKAEELLNEIITQMKVSATVKVSEDDSHILASIEGEDAGILIGREGQTLDALQLIANIFVNKGEEERTRIIVDAEGYKDRRKESIERLANSLAEKVTGEQEPVNLEPMNAFERRIVHMTLRESTDVITESQGEGSERHVVIKPL
ncbi:hypothetical protein LCGC14_1196030 [marine sediment metagenome]|uniref:R3H domain-containing protein n=1 Tax=marine sediment metagenome TaxID=412755 RepID=A0A0F9LIH0_9ZZZZ